MVPKDQHYKEDKHGRKTQQRGKTQQRFLLFELPSLFCNEKHT